MRATDGVCSHESTFLLNMVSKYVLRQDQVDILEPRPFLLLFVGEKKETKEMKQDRRPHTVSCSVTRRGLPRPPPFLPRINPQPLRRHCPAQPLPPSFPSPTAELRPEEGRTGAKKAKENPSCTARSNAGGILESHAKNPNPTNPTNRAAPSCPCFFWWCVVSCSRSGLAICLRPAASVVPRPAAVMSARR